jgi:hypothetical protein
MRSAIKQLRALRLDQLVLRIDVASDLLSTPLATSGLDEREVSAQLRKHLPALTKNGGGGYLSRSRIQPLSQPMAG